MKSIRRSLLVYFLLLLTAALGAVSWFSYQTTAQSLRQRKLDAEKMIKTQFDSRIAGRVAELDRQLLRQARAMAGMPLVTLPYEALFTASVVSQYALSQDAFGAFMGGSLWLPSGPNPPVRGGVPQHQLYVPLLVAQFQFPNNPKSNEIKRDWGPYFPKYSHLQSSEFLLPNLDVEHPQEYFQTYRGDEKQPMQRSQSMGEAQFKLSKATRKSLTLFMEEFDNVELRPSVKVRRVTLKTPIAGFGGVRYWPWIGGKGPQPGQFGKGGGAKGPPKAPPRAIDAPTLFIQYAADLEPLEEKTLQFAAVRDQQLAELETTITDDLNQLRNRMIWVSLVTLAAIWLGGYGVIHLGLAPLSKMSDAVSKVTPKNFHLSVDPETLPDELQPIAARLREVLQHLQQAFAREKQAAADISHELRTPLAALMTTLEVGLRKNRNPEEYREILAECRSSGQHMYQLVERLLTLARLDAGVDQYYPRQVDVIDTALQCADLIRPLAKARGITVRLHLPDAVMLQTDPDKLREVLVNLLHNAIEYNKPHGSIDLSVERVNGHARLAVRDSGIGITPDALGHIFERFYRADPSRQADTPHAGLGLSIVKSYVALMDGVIQVESSEAGTAFIIELPIGATPQPTETAIHSMEMDAQMVP
jgi:two-component system, OmpR family, heavy metal sensor histidine kinase CusS